MSDSSIFSSVHPRLGLSKKSLRRKLSGFGFRGDRLHQELTRIMAGPQLRTSQSHMLDNLLYYPFGWQAKELTRPMRRIFFGVNPLPITACSDSEVVSIKRRRSVISIAPDYFPEKKTNN